MLWSSALMVSTPLIECHPNNPKLYIFNVLFLSSAVCIGCMNRFPYGQIAAYMRTTVDSIINKDYVDNQFLRTECFWWSSGGSDDVQLRTYCYVTSVLVH